MNLLNKTGFYHTLRLLDDIPLQQAISLKLFYAKFNEDSYYNAFFRVRKALLNAKLIQIRGRGQGRKIKITPRGARVWAMLSMVFGIIGGVSL